VSRLLSLNSKGLSREARLLRHSSGHLWPHVRLSWRLRKTTRRLWQRQLGWASRKVSQSSRSPWLVSS